MRHALSLWIRCVVGSDDLALHLVDIMHLLSFDHKLEQGSKAIIVVEMIK
jgi:hypothetical protein